MADFTIREVQQRVEVWITESGTGYWNPHAMLARLMEEVGETARVINQLYGPKIKKDGEAQQELSLELADILFTIICIANAQNIDLQVAFEQVLEKYNSRK